MLEAAGKTDAAARECGNYSEARFSPFKQIDTTKVQRLGLTWSVET